MPTVESHASGTGAPEDALRKSLVNAACEGWTGRLIDLSRRNNLLFYKPIVSGTLELPITARLSEFLISGKTLPIRDLLADDQERISHIRGIARKGLENLEEKGLSTLYLALGKCTWTADDGGRDPIAPALLVPINLKLKGQDVRATEIQTAGDAQVNPVLLHIFHRELNVSVSPDELLRLYSPLHDFGTNGNGRGNGVATAADSTEGEEIKATANVDAVLGRLNVVAASVPGFKTERFAVIGNFSFQKLAMVKDLENRPAELVANEVVAAIAGDNVARANLSKCQIETDPACLDKVFPENEFAVVEADSSQQCAIAGINAGQSAVVHGPPGTGKSQTITNLITTLAANGKKVLFVAEKRAALEVVMNRLKAVGLDHLAIDLHGAEQTPKKVMERVARTLSAVRDAAKPHAETVHEQFIDRRTRLNQHDARMHTVHAPTEQTVFAMQGALLRLRSDISSQSRWRGPDLTQITAKTAARILDLLGEAAGFETLFNRTDPSPWTGVVLKDGPAMQDAIDTASRLSYELLPELNESLRKTAVSAGVRSPKTLLEIEELLKLLERANKILASYQSEIFAESSGLLDAISPGQAGGLKSAWYRLTSSNYKTTYKRAISLRNNSKASGAVVFHELKDAADIATLWKKWSGSNAVPKAVPERTDCDNNHKRTNTPLQALQMTCQKDWTQLELPEICSKIGALASDNATPYRIRQLCEIERELQTLGVQRLVDEIRTTRKPAEQWPALFQYIWIKSTLDMLAINDPGIHGFVGTTHNGYVEDFKRLDSNRLELARARVRRAHAERTIAAMNQFPEQETLIRGEAAKSRRHKPLRQMFAQATEVLTAVCPCWMASPLSVCQLISSTGIFDYVIFDEASQITPEDAVPSILRGKHVIVAGDNKQLPPTAFFTAAEEDDDCDVDATSYESLLDMMIPFVKGFHLNWHYRSRDEVLISFSNHHIYDDRLVTFPGPGGTTAISHVYVNYVPSSDGQEDSSGGEVDKVVAMVIRHAQTTPSLTLGVITMGIKHANRIQAVLDRELANQPELAEFFDSERPERFFIKNLERVQGDERDVIIISIGYGKDRAGNLPLRFGPILSAGGRRRLNVAATRAKERVIVVSSFLYSDINSTQVRPGTGLEFLKYYIEYASSGGQRLSHGELTNEPMDDFEADVFEALIARGIELVPQVGCSKYRIDLAALHPSNPGKFVLAIECDGATYHSSYTARDRDRLRQQQLENLGWTFHRIWSTDWFMRKNEEVDRAVRAFNKAVEASDRPQSSKSASRLADRSERSDSSSGQKHSSRSSPRAPIPIRESITEYTNAELQALLQWVQSDGKLRTNEELAEEMFAALPFVRRGARIEAILDRTIQMWERTMKR